MLDSGRSAIDLNKAHFSVFTGRSALCHNFYLSLMQVIAIFLKSYGAIHWFLTRRNSKSLLFVKAA